MLTFYMYFPLNDGITIHWASDIGIKNEPVFEVLEFSHSVG